jgi:quercetin dioxygenase-like cupin family protein
MSNCMRRLAALGTATLFARGTTGVACGHGELPAAGTADTTITPLLVRPLPESPEREAMMLTLELAPGAATEPHRHDAHTFVYVLEGSAVMQVQGGPEVTLAPGQTFYEAPTDIHAVGRNASATGKAKSLAFFIKNVGAAPSCPSSNAVAGRGPPGGVWPLRPEGAAHGSGRRCRRACSRFAP